MAASAGVGSGGEISGSRPAVRLYAEWSEQGVRVWLGADADQALPLAQIGAQLQQWLGGQGERLVELVCNGRTVWRDTLGKPNGRPFSEVIHIIPPTYTALASRRPS